MAVKLELGFLTQFEISWMIEFFQVKTDWSYKFFLYKVLNLDFENLKIAEYCYQGGPGA